MVHRTGDGSDQLERGHRERRAPRPDPRSRRARGQRRRNAALCDSGRGRSRLSARSVPISRRRVLRLALSTPDSGSAAGAQPARSELRRGEYDGLRRTGIARCAKGSRTRGAHTPPQLIVAPYTRLHARAPHARTRASHARTRAPHTHVHAPHTHVRARLTRTYTRLTRTYAR